MTQDAYELPHRSSRATPSAARTASTSSTIAATPYAPMRGPSSRPHAPIAAVIRAGGVTGPNATPRSESQATGSERPVPRVSTISSSRRSSSGPKVAASCEAASIAGPPLAGPNSIPSDGRDRSRRGSTAKATVVVPNAGLARSIGTVTPPHRAPSSAGTSAHGASAGPGSCPFAGATPSTSVATSAMIWTRRSRRMTAPFRPCRHRGAPPPGRPVDPTPSHTAMQRSDRRAGDDSGTVPDLQEVEDVVHVGLDQCGEHHAVRLQLPRQRERQSVSGDEVANLGVDDQVMDPCGPPQAAELPADLRRGEKILEHDPLLPVPRATRVIGHRVSAQRAEDDDVHPVVLSGL